MESRPEVHRGVRGGVQPRPTTGLGKQHCECWLFSFFFHINCSINSIPTTTQQFPVNTLNCMEVAEQGEAQMREQRVLISSIYSCHSPTWLRSPDVQYPLGRLGHPSEMCGKGPYTQRFSQIRPGAGGPPRRTWRRPQPACTCSCSCSCQQSSC